MVISGVAGWQRNWVYASLSCAAVGVSVCVVEFAAVAVGSVKNFT